MVLYMEMSEKIGEKLSKKPKNEKRKTIETGNMANEIKTLKRLSIVCVCVGVCVHVLVYAEVNKIRQIRLFSRVH